MFCVNCGKELADGTRFCIHCGAPQNQAPAAPQNQAPAVPRPDPAPVYPEEEKTVYAPPAAEVPVQEPAYEAPVYAPVYQEPQNVPPVYQQPEIPTYSDAPMNPVPKKKKKTGLIIALVIVLLLAIGGGVGFLLYSQHQANVEAYEEAEALLDARDYDAALKAFTDLGDFEDAANQAKKLVELQDKYDAAVSLLEERKYNDAAAAFKKLKDYRDSENYVNSEIAYQRALFVQESADKGDFDEALQIVAGGDMVYEQGSELYMLYSYAAGEFYDLGNYADSVERVSQCWLKVALFELEKGEYTEALSYKDRLSEEDAATLDQAYADACADGRFLLDVVDSYVAWYDDYYEYSFGEEIEKAYEIIEPYFEEYFADSYLEELLWNYAYSLETMYSAVDDYGDVSDWVIYYEGMAELYATADLLYENYGVFADDSYLVDNFVGYTEVTAAYPYIEDDLMYWWNYEASADMMDDGHYYATYTNYSGYSFTLYATVYFYDVNDELLEVSEEMEIYVAEGATVYIPTIPTTISDDDWYYWGMDWWFSVY